MCAGEDRGVPPERGHSTDREHRAGPSGRGIWRRAGAAILCAVMAGTPFLAGAAALPITPLPEHLEERIYLGGYDGYLGRPAGGVHDDLFRDNWTRWRAAVITFGLNEAAYMAEIVRGGILSVESGQMDAAKSLGMTNLQAMRRVILPQALRVVVPPTGNELIAMLKNTSVAFAIGVVELMNAAKIQAAQSFKVMELYTVAAFWYLVLVSIFSLLQAELERALTISERERPETLFSRALTLMGGRRGI